MKIEQFEDKGLAQYSYAVLSECTREIILIDPARDPQPYFDFALAQNAKIVGVILTHSHADFVSSHAEIQREAGAKIYVSSHMEARFPHQKVDDGSTIVIGKITLKVLYTPGHSFDSVSILLEHEGRDKAIFTGDTLFIGDVGRPDLRGNGKDSDKMRRDLAKAMYATIHNKFKKLDEDVVVYPGHGAGTLCGKSLSTDSSSTIGREVKENYALQNRSEEDFVELLLDNQPFIPPYFSFDVALNKAGAENFASSLKSVRKSGVALDRSGELVIDTRPEREYKKAHIKGSINIQNGAKFETWLGTIVSPDRKFILVAKDDKEFEDVVRKAAKIGYETNIKEAIVNGTVGDTSSDILNVNQFKNNVPDYSIVDIRNNEEAGQNKLFNNSINIPLPDLLRKVREIPLNKPLVVHCAGGYRSAIGASILERELPGVKVFDLSEAVKDFQNS